MASSKKCLSLKHSVTRTYNRETVLVARSTTPQIHLSQASEMFHPVSTALHFGELPLRITTGLLQVRNGTRTFNETRLSVGG
jgi:hypothetical protein